LFSQITRFASELPSLSPTYYETYGYSCPQGSQDQEKKGKGTHTPSEKIAKEYFLAIQRAEGGHQNDEKNDEDNLRQLHIPVKIASQLNAKFF